MTEILKSKKTVDTEEVQIDLTGCQRSMQALRESEDKHRTLIEKSLDAIAIVKGERLVFVNKAFLEMFGYESDKEVIGSTITEYLAPQSQALVKSRGLAREMGEVVPARYEVKAQKKDGTIFDVELSVGLITFQGEVARQGVIRDITQRKSMEQALRESEEKFRLFQSSVFDVIYRYDPQNNRYDFISPSVEQQTGYTIEEFLSRPQEITKSITNPEDWERVQYEIKQEIAKGPPGKPFHAEYRVIRKDKKEIWVSDQKTLEFSPEGKLRRINGVVRDITERKQTEETLRSAHRKLQASFDAIQESMSVVDLEFNLTDVNDALIKKFGLSDKESVLGHKCFAALKGRKENCPNCAVAEAYRTKAPAYRTSSPEDKALTRGRSCEIFAYPIMDDRGNLIGAVEFARDVTERKRAVEALRKSEEKYKFLYEQSPVVNIVIGIDGTIKDVNKALIEKLGYSKDEIISKQALEFVIPKQKEKVAAQLERAFKGEYTPEIDVDVYAKDGSIHTILFSPGQVILQEENQSTCILITGIDITERKQAEEALQKSEKKYRQLIENMREGIWCIDKDAYTTFLNPRMAEILGYSVEEMQGRHLFSFMDEHGVELCKRYLERRKQGIKEQHDFEFLRKDGTRVYTSLETSAIVDGDGNYLGAVACVADITKRKRAEEALQESEKRLRGLFETMTEGMVLIAPDGQIVQANPAAEHILGLRRSEIEGRNYIGAEWKILRPDGTQMPPDEMAGPRAMKDKSPQKDVVMGVERPDGSISWISVNAAPLRDEAGKLEGVVGTFTDITERRQAEEKLKEYTRQIQEKNLELRAKNQALTATRAQLVQEEKLRALGQMASGVAHNFNNLLAIVLGRAQLLQRKVKELEIEKGLRSIEKAALDASSTVKRIQDFARIRKDQEFKWVNIDEEIEDVIALTKTKWKDQAEANGASITFELQKDRRKLPPVAGDASELREVFTNIIFNAVEAMPKGGKIIINTSTDRKSVFVSFTDSGVGIPEEIKQRIFDPFFTTKGVTNAGLGLSVAYGIIQRHQGDIQIESKQGEGTTVVVRLPLSNVLGKEEPKEEESERSPVSGESAKILVIEDAKDIRELLFDILSSANYVVKLAPGGAEGLEICKMEKFDIVFTDLGMPRMSGWEVAKAIKEIDSSTAVFLITGWGVEMDEKRLKESGVDRIVTKPIQIENLLTLVSEAIELKNRAKGKQEDSWDA